MRDSNVDDVFWLRASGRGNGVGLTALASEVAGATLVVHVLPKTWRSQSAPEIVATPERGGTISVYEGDYVAFTSIWQSIAKKHLADPVAQLVDDEEDPAGSRVGDPLWTRETPRYGTSQREPGDSAFSVSRMWRLVLGSKLKPASAPRSVLPSPTGVHALADLPELGDLVKATFVDAAASAIPRRKPLYREIREPIASVRGRIVPRSLVTRAIQRDVSVVCEFDDLSTDYLLWRVVRTALEECISVPGRYELTFGCLAQLPDVEPMGRLAALRGVQVLRSSIRDPALLALVLLAADVLGENFGLASDRAHGSAVLANVRFMTSGLWERLLVAAFRRGGCTVTPEPPLDILYVPRGDRWIRGEEKRPDFLVRSPEGRQFLVDAKYICKTSFRDAAKGDQYQAIAYAQRSGMTTLLAYARPAYHELAMSAEMPLLAIPPSSWIADGRPPFEADDRWTHVGAATFHFPQPDDDDPLESLSEDVASAVEAVESLATRD